MPVSGVTGWLFLVADNEEPQPDGQSLRDNVVAIDLERFRVLRLSQDELAHGVAAAGQRLFLTTSRGTPLSHELRQFTDGTIELVPELGPVRANDVAGADDQLLWTDAGDTPIEWASFDTRNLRLWTVGDPDIRTVATGGRTLRGPSFGPAGEIAVLEMKDRRGRAPQCSLLILSPEGQPVLRLPLDILGRHWFPDSTFWCTRDRVALGGGVGQQESGEDALAVVDLGAGEVVDARERCRPLAVSPDRTCLILRHQRYEATYLSVIEHLHFDRARWLGQMPFRTPRGAAWLDRVPPGVDINRRYPLTGEAIDMQGRPSRIDRVVLGPARPRAAVPATGIRLSAGAADRLDAYGGSLYVLIREADDPEAAARALDRARPDLISLDTPPAWEEEGWDALPNMVWPVQNSPSGPYTCVDANDTDNELLRRIPAILRRHLDAEGVKSAVIDFPDHPPH